MAYKTRAYTDEHGDPVVVLVVTGTHDVGRLAGLFCGAQVLVEQLQTGEAMRRQARRHASGRAALELLKAHGGPDFTDEITQDALDGQALAALMVAAEQLLLDCSMPSGTPTPQRKRALRAAIDGVERRFFDVLEAAAADASKREVAVAL